MTGKSENKNSANNSIAHNGEKIKSFDTLKSNFETAKQETFTALLVNYTFQANPKTRTSEKDYTKALTDLATAIAYSVLKKCIETSQNQTLVEVKRDIAKDTALLNNTQYAMLNAYDYRYNKDGEKVRYTKDKDLATALNKLCASTLGEGIDLVNTAIVQLLAEYEKATQRTLYTLYDECDKELYSGYEKPECVPDSITADAYLDNNYFIEITPMCNHIQWLETPYPVRRLKRKVWIKTAESVKGWETVETTPIQEVCKAVRRAVEQSRAVQTDARNGYTYLEDTATDTESNTTATIYRRLPKYADLGGKVCDFNGKETAYTATAETVENTDRILANLNLSKQQAEILKLRLSGYGYKAIATYLGVREDNIKVQIKRIQAKAIAIELKPATK